MASVAKTLGSGTDLIPEGMDLNTIPNDLFTTIEQSLRILGWQENLASDEIPPEWMWALDWEINTWFKNVKINRDKKYGSGSSGEVENDEGEGMFEENVYFERMKRGDSVFE